jgi:hypothetical protein
MKFASTGPPDKVSAVKKSDPQANAISDDFKSKFYAKSSFTN